MLEEAAVGCQAAGLVHGLFVPMPDGPEGGIARSEAERAARV